MSKKLYNQFNGSENKLKSLKANTQNKLNELALYIYQNSHSVRGDVKTDMDLYGEVAKAMIYKSLDGLDNNATPQAIKDEITKVMLLEGLVAKQEKHLEGFKDKYQTGIDIAADTLAKKIKARGGTPQSAFETIALDNPGWFRQIIEFFARCLFISTEYNAMRSVKNQSQEMNEEVKKAEMRRHLVKGRVFEKIAEPQQINGSVHQVGKVKKAEGDKQVENNKHKHKQEWFKKTNDNSALEKRFKDYSPIQDPNAREVIGAEVLRTLMGDNNVPKYRLTEDGSVISQQVGFDKDHRNYKKTRTLGGFLADDDNINPMDLMIKFQQGDEDAKHKLEKLENNLRQKLTNDREFAKEFAKLHGYSMIAGNIDATIWNIMLVENNQKEGDFKYDMVPIDFGYSISDSSKDQMRELVEKLGGFMQPALPDKQKAQVFNKELFELQAVNNLAQTKNIAFGKKYTNPRDVQRVNAFNREVYNLPAVKDLCNKHGAVYQANINNLGFIAKIRYLWNINSIIPNKSQMLLPLVPEKTRKEVLQEVVKEVEGKKEELYKKIEDTCYALGIGASQASLVMKTIDRNIELVKREAGMDVGKKI